MAEIDDLISQVDDDSLRARLREAARDLRSAKSFGLVFERHLPEAVPLPLLDLQPGDTAIDRRNEAKQYTVKDILPDNNVLVTSKDSENIVLPREFVFKMQTLGSRIAPVLQFRADAGQTDASAHVVIKGENYFALQLLRLLYCGSIDCIYIDPPYNTGAKDWKYNNDYVDSNDSWRHSKWLSFMEKRLKIAASLLRDNGVLIIAIDENEHAHLVALLEQMFPKHDVTSISIVHNPRGIQGDNFSFVHDYAIFVTPKGSEVIARRALQPEERVASSLRNWGGESDRSDAANCFYPILIRDNVIVGFGEVPDDDFHPSSANVTRDDGTVEIWPIDNNMREKKWRYARQSVESVRELLSVRASSNGVIQVDITKATAAIKTVWADARYDASTYGTQVVNKLTGTKFPFPKSIYTVKDCLAAVCTDRPNALILDFFGGSGTTLHAAMMLNSEIGGSRRAIIVTNNEVSPTDERRMRRAGQYRGDAGYEGLGIAEAVTWPRVVASITGIDAKGQAVLRSKQGAPISSDPLQGFAERAIFADLVLLDADEVAYGESQRTLTQSVEILLGEYDDGNNKSEGFRILTRSRVAFLFDDQKTAEFIEAVTKVENYVSTIILFSEYRDLVSHLGTRFPTMAIKILPADYLESVVKTGSES